MRIVPVLAVLAALSSGCAGKRHADLAATEAAMADLRAELERCRATSSNAVLAKELSEKRLAAYRDLAERLRAALGLEQVDILIRNGRLVVQLPNQVLFDSGKATVSPEGRDILTRIGPVLRDADRRFLIAGHTDDVPVKAESARFKDNWELSALRATNAVKVLVSAGVPPSVLGAAGYAEWLPDAPNDDDAGRAQNRRLEIIVMPKLDEIPTLPSEL